MSSPLVEIDRLTFSYRGAAEPAVRDVSLRVCPGEFLVLTGPSGCGKSTFCRCLDGLVPHCTEGTFEGDVRIKGVNTKEHEVSDLSRAVGMVFQDPENQLLANDVEAEVAFGLENLGVAPLEIEALVTWALSVTGIEGLRKRQIDELSGGEKQRVAVAAAMAMKPELLVLDEPTSEIDPAGAFSLIETLKRLNQEEGLTIVLAEHRIERLLGVMSRLAVMDHGAIVYDGPPAEVFANDLGKIGVFMPPLVNFCWKFGLPFAGKVEEISMDGEWRAEIQDRSLHQGGLAASAIDIHYRYTGTGTDVLRGVSLNVYRGEILAIMGANGSGKTTLVKHFNGLLRPGRGKVLLGGRDIEGSTVAENAKIVGFVCQNVNHQLFEEDVKGELTFGPLNLGFPPDRADAMARKAAESLGLDAKFLALSPFSLSGGEKQRVAIAGALASGPEILVLDEPTLGLNQGLKLKLAAAMARIRDNDRAVVLVTHDVEFAAAFADRVVVMADGKVLADGAAREVLASDVPVSAALHHPQATEIGRRLGIGGVMAVDEIVRGSSGVSSP